MSRGDVRPTEPVGLSEAALHHYHAEGWVLLRSFFSKPELVPVADAIDELLRPKGMMRGHAASVEFESERLDGSSIPARIHHPYELDAAFRDLCSDEHLLASVESIIGPNINLQHSKVSLKSAFVGSAVPWHQDLAYFPHTNDDLVSVFVYLDDADDENGCLRVLSARHRAFFDHHTDDGRFTGAIMVDIEGGGWGSPVPLPAPAGSVVLAHCNTPHGSDANRSDRSRRMIIFEYRAADSFPIFFHREMVDANLPRRVLRGTAAQYARFGGPRPYIPMIDE